MSIKLKLFLIIICLIFDIFMYSKITDGKLQLKYSLVWYLLSLILILVTLFDNILIPIKYFLGFETTSMMVFLIGFFLLAALVFSLNLKISEQSKKITRLTQEIALLKKGAENENSN